MWHACWVCNWPAQHQHFCYKLWNLVYLWRLRSICSRLSDIAPNCTVHQPSITAVERQSMMDGRNYLGHYVMPSTPFAPLGLSCTILHLCSRRAVSWNYPSCTGNSRSSTHISFSCSFCSLFSHTLNCTIIIPLDACSLQKTSSPKKGLCVESIKKWKNRNAHHLLLNVHT